MNTLQKLHTLKEDADYMIDFFKEVKREVSQMEQTVKASDTELTNSQAASLLEVSKRTVIRMKNDGRLKSTRFKDVFEYKKNR